MIVKSINRMKRRVENLNLLLVTIYEDYGDHFHQGDHNEADGTGEAVKHFQPIFPSTGAENESHEKANNTDNT